jgi:hypothetical protein
MTVGAADDRAADHASGNDQQRLKKLKEPSIEEGDLLVARAGYDI